MSNRSFHRNEAPLYCKGCLMLLVVITLFIFTSCAGSLVVEWDVEENPVEETTEVIE